MSKVDRVKLEKQLWTIVFSLFILDSFIVILEYDVHIVLRTIWLVLMTLALIGVLVVRFLFKK